MRTRKRNRPSKAGEQESNVQPFSVREFFATFPDDDACLQQVMEVGYGLRHVCQKCDNDATFHKLEQRRAYCCAACGDHVYPCAGTIFQDSRTSLQTWFYAIYLFIAARDGVSGRELQRTLGVTYKTAWRIGRQTRDLMGKANGFEVLKGHVEVVEAYVGGRRSGGKRGRGAEGKTIITGMAKRGGPIVAKAIPDVKKATLGKVVLDNFEERSIVSTDELISYGLLQDDGCLHGIIEHDEKLQSYNDCRHDAVHNTNRV